MREIESEIEAVNAAFYEAFRERNLAAMINLWAKNVPVACAHPGMKAIEGRASVMASWRGILAHPQSPKMECSNVRVHLLGTAAFVTCHEGGVGEAPRLLATNVFVLEEGRWLVVHHHAGPLSPEALRRGPPSEPPPAVDPSSLN